MKPIKKPEVIKVNRKLGSLRHSVMNSTLDTYKRSDNLIEGLNLKHASLNPKQAMKSFSDKLSLQEQKVSNHSGMKLQEIKFVRQRKSNGRNTVMGNTRGDNALQFNHMRDSVS